MENLSLNPNPLVQFLGKTPSEFTKADLIKFIEENGIEMLNFRYPGTDGRLKALNFVIQSRKHLDEILTSGERVDGSSLFRHIEASSSDLYVVPRYRTAFVNPFTEIPTLELLCSYYDKDGKPLKSSPEYILRRAHEVLKERTGYSFETMGELEYYTISPREELFEATDQRGYHEAFPLTNGRASAPRLCMLLLKLEHELSTDIARWVILHWATNYMNKMKLNFCVVLWKKLQIRLLLLSGLCEASPISMGLP